MKKTVNRGIEHPRGDNADYHLSDVVLLTLVGMVGGATSMAKVMTVWADSVLRKVAGWVKVPVEITVLRIFKEVSDAQINQFEALTHTLRGQHWRRLLRSGKSKVGIQLGCRNTSILAKLCTPGYWIINNLKNRLKLIDKSC